ncbi:MAG: MBL fold metallo-hydrolase [Thermoleophilia bacterium]|nr:MBL fold metallo-hydrolase [Thermoleophilia bacterium]
MFIQICGAARAVTGSCFLVEVGDTRFLVDCGMHQGGDREEALNFERFSFDPDELDFVLLTHAHIDHSGRLPRLVKQGFSGPIYATPATCDLVEIMLLDSAYIQEMEAEWQTRKARRAGRKAAEPLYDQADARETLPLLKPVEYGKSRQVALGVNVVFHDAGHILGSALLELELEENGAKASVVFSGDVGQPDQPIIRDPTILEHTDYLVMESTYGDRVHERNGEPKAELAAILKDAKRSGGNVIIPAFAVGRTQEILYFLREIFVETDLDMPVYVDSPLASRATEIFRRHRDVFDEEAWKIVGEPGGIFDFPMVKYTESADESKKLNEERGVVIISASGMADAGRVRHHLKHNLWRPESHVVIVGFQAQGSLGRRIKDGADKVRLFGEDIAVKAHIHDLDGLSAHADQEQLLSWASNFKSPRLVILTHGEETAVLTLKKLLEDKLNFKVAVADMNEVFDLARAPRRRQ